MGDVLWQVGMQLEPLFHGLVADQAHERFQYLAELEVDLFEGEPLGLDLGDVEDVVDDMKQVLRCLGDLGELGA